MKIYLDDDPKERHPPSGEWVRVFTPDEFKETVIRAHETGEPIEAISFDNDLGFKVEGRHLFQWLLDTYPEDVVGTTEIEIHSENNEAKRWMRGTLDWARRNKEQILEMKNRPDPWSDMKIV